MHIISRLICEILSRIAVKISFLWGRKHCVYAAVSFAAIVASSYLRNDMQNCTCIILYMNIICNACWLYGANFEILHCSGAFSRRQKLFKPVEVGEHFQANNCRFFFTAKIWHHLRYASYAKGPFCVARLISCYYFHQSSDPHSFLGHVLWPFSPMNLLLWTLEWKWVRITTSCQQPKCSILLSRVHKGK